MNDLDDDDLRVDLTPLIDVTFMLVIFFLMTMSFTLPVLDFTLPQSQTAQVAAQRATVRLSVDATGSYFLNNEPCAYADLAAKLQEHVLSAHQAGQELTLELLIDAQAPSQYLINVADLARTYTQGRLTILSAPTAEPLTPAKTHAPAAHSNAATSITAAEEQ